MKKIFILFTLLIYSFAFAQNNTNQIDEGNIKPEESTKYRKAIQKYNDAIYSDAIVLLKELIQANSDKSSMYYFDLASAYLYNKQYDECIITSTKGIQIDKEENLLYLRRAEANIALNKLETVCSDLKAAFNTDLLQKYCN